MARVSALILAIALLLAGAGTATAALKKGDRGAQVAKVQRWLNQPDDGIFGRGTKAAVKRFQRRKGLTPDGVVGPATWAAALRRGHRAATRRTTSATRVRSRGGAVRKLQRRLGIAADGVFGLATAGRRQALPAHPRPTADGVVGPATRAALGHAGWPGAQAQRPPSAPAPAAGPTKVRAIVSAANQIAGKPYKYGGGHGNVERHGLRLLGLVSERAARRGCSPARAIGGDFMSCGAAGKGRGSRSTRTPATSS